MRLFLFYFVILSCLYCQVTDENEDRFKKLEAILEKQNQKILELEKKIDDKKKFEEKIDVLETIIENQNQKINKLELEINNKVTPLEELEKEQDESLVNEKEDYTQQIILQYLEQVESINELRMGYDNGFFLRSYDSTFEIYFKGAMQIGIGIFENDSSDNNSIFLNALYLSFEATLFQHWLFRVEIDLNGFRDNGDGLFNNPEFFEPRLKDFYIEYNAVPEFQIRIGQMHVPFTIEGQYKEYESISIFTEPFIRSWSHGRDPGIMILGTFADSFEYKASIHNGEGENKANQTDDFLLAGQLRFFPLKKSQNPQTFLHIGAIRSRDNRLKNDGDFGSASLFTPWGRHVYGDNLNLNNGNLAQTQGWQTAIDMGLKVVIANFWLESEFLFFEWERDLDTFGKLGRVFGMGASIGLRHHLNLNGQKDGSGIFTTIKFSYTDIDDYHNSNALASSIDGQSIYSYTLGFGYAFNYNVWVNMNWIFLDVVRAQVDPADENGNDRQDDLENGLFIQMTTVW